MMHSVHRYRLTGDWSHIPRTSLDKFQQYMPSAERRGQTLPFSLMTGNRQTFEKESPHPFLTKDHCRLG